MSKYSKSPMRGYSQYIIKRYGTFTEPAFVSVGVCYYLFVYLNNQLFFLIKDPYVAPGTAA